MTPSAFRMEGARFFIRISILNKETAQDPTQIL